MSLLKTLINPKDNKKIYPVTSTDGVYTTTGNILSSELTTFIKKSQINSANGVAGLDANGKVPSSQLPSYVDDVLEFANKAAFPATGESGKIYVDKATNLTWRWSGSAYVEISPSLALGETSSTAYAGNKGKANADAISTLQTTVDALPKTYAPTNAQANVIETIKVNNTVLTPTNKAVNVTVPTKISDLTNDSNFVKVSDDAQTYASGDNVLYTSNISDNLTTDVATNALSARQGKVLNEKIGEVNNTLSYYEDKGFLSNNKYDKSNYIGIFVGTDGKLYSSNVIKSAYALLKPNTTYTIKKRKTSRYIVGIANGITTQSVGTFLQNNANITEYTFTTTSEYTYLIATVWHSTDDASISLNEVLDSVQINEGSEALPYTPYAPSNTELGDEVSRINENLTQEALDLKMLGWTVPKECPIQNEVNGNQFIQKVGRIKLSNAEWLLSGTTFFTKVNTIGIKDGGSTRKADIYVTNGYIVQTADADKIMFHYGTQIYAKDSAYTNVDAFKNHLDAEEIYAYFELATPITTTIDGNEAVSKINENLSEIKDGTIITSHSLNVLSYLKKNGKIATLTVYLTTASEVSAWTNLLTIPAEFAPLGYIFAPTTTSTFVSILSNGQVQPRANIPTNTVVAFSATYICS